MPQVAVVIPAYTEADRIGATVAAAAKLSDASRPVTGPVVHDNDDVYVAECRRSRDGGADTVRFVVGRDDNGYLWHRQMLAAGGLTCPAAPRGRLRW